MPMRTENDLPEGISVRIIDNGESFKVEYVDGRGSTAKVAGGIKLGEVKVSKIENYQGWHVTFSQAMNRFGPLLYDVAIEYATIKGGGLTSDRYGSVSTHASDVWEKYYNDRSDVKKTPLPNDMRREHDTHPSSFLYKKDPVRINNLKASGKLIEKN